MKSELKFKFATWNIDTDLYRIEEGYARESHPEWRIVNCIPYICQRIKQINADIINVQELKNTLNKYDETIDSLTPLKNYLEIIGYGVLIHPYNSINNKAFWYITAYKKDEFKAINNKLKYFTKTPDTATLRPNAESKNREQIEATIRENNYGEVFERGTFITHFKHIKTGQDIIDFNIHLGIPIIHRKEASKLITEFAKQELTYNTNAKIVIGGDFNSFTGKEGIEQINIIKNATLNGKALLTEVSDKLYLISKKPVSEDNKELAPENNTFIFYPFDFGSNNINIYELQNLKTIERKKAIEEIFKKDTCRAIGGQLDHIFVHGLTTR